MYKQDIINLLEIQGSLVKKIKRDEKSINIYLESNPKLHICPSCSCYTKKIHDYRIQTIQHINIGNFQSFIHLKKRRYICKHCSKKFYEHYDFLTKYFRKSNSVFKSVSNDLKQLKNFKTIAEDNNVSIPTVIRYMNHAISLSKKNVYKLPKKIGIDEFKGNCNHTKYQFHIFDLDTHRTIDILPSCSYNFLENYFSKFTLQERLNVEVVSMDLYSPFKRVIKDKFPSASIIADIFHYTRIAIQPLEELRLNLFKNTKGKEKLYFKNIKYALMKDISKVKDNECEKLLHAFELSPTLKSAYNLKQQFLDIKKLDCSYDKERAFMKWIKDTEYSNINEFSYAVTILKQWHKYISNSFKYDISNGPIEGKNNLIKTLKRIAFGFRNLNNFRNRILICEL